MAAAAAAAAAAAVRAAAGRRGGRMVARGFKELQRAEDARELASDRDRMEAKLEDMEAKLEDREAKLEDMGAEVDRLGLSHAFSLFDADGDGKLTFAEVMAVLTRKTPTRNELSEEDARATWRRWQQRFDLNNDGKISYEELVDDMVAHPMRWGATTVIEELAAWTTSD